MFKPFNFALLTDKWHSIKLMQAFTNMQSFKLHITSSVGYKMF